MKRIAWYDGLLLVGMMIMAGAMLVDFHVGLWSALLLATMALVKIVAERRIGNRTLTRPLRLLLYAPIAYWLCHAVSILFGGDAQVGLHIIRLKAGLLIYPIVFLLADTSFLSRRRMWLIGYALWGTCFATFLYHLGHSTAGLIQGQSFAHCFGYGFDPRHHAYTALYVAVALFFVYVRLTASDAPLRWMRRLLIASIPLFILYIIIVNSRAGMLTLWGLVLLCGIHSMRRKVWQGLLLIVLTGGLIVGIETALPGHQNRIWQTVQNIRSGKGDARININENSLQLVKDTPLSGHGVSSYHQEQMDNFAANGEESYVKANYNAHNQYLESLLSTGVVGLLLLLAFIFAPIAVTIVLHSKALFPIIGITFIFSFNLLFESMLERQMGILFIGYFVSLTPLIISVVQKKFGGIENN